MRTRTGLADEGIFKDNKLRDKKLNFLKQSLAEFLPLDVTILMQNENLRIQTSFALTHKLTLEVLKANHIEVQGDNILVINPQNFPSFFAIAKFVGDLYQACLYTKLATELATPTQNKISYRDTKDIPSADAAPNSPSI